MQLTSKRGVATRIQEQIADAKAKIARINESLSPNSGNRFEATLDAVYADDIRTYWEKRLSELEDLLQNYKIAKPTSRTGIQVEEVIRLLKLGTRKVLEFRISDRIGLFRDEKVVSSSSPIGLAVIGKQVGDVVTVNTPRGIFKYRIMAQIQGRS